MGIPKVPSIPLIAFVLILCFTISAQEQLNEGDIFFYFAETDLPPREITTPDYVLTKGDEGDKIVDGYVERFREMSSKGISFHLEGWRIKGFPEISFLHWRVIIKYFDPARQKHTEIKFKIFDDCVEQVIDFKNNVGNCKEEIEFDYYKLGIGTTSMDSVYVYLRDF